MTPPAPDAPLTPREGPSRRSRPGGRSRGAAKGGGKKGVWWIFLLGSLVPVAVAVFWFTRPAEVREKFRESIPPGVASRAIAAGIALVGLFVLARLVLPGAKNAVQALARAGERFRALPTWKRVLAFPGEAGLDVAWTLAQVLFALDVVAIFACGAAFVLYAIRIVKPEMFTFLPG